MKKRLGWFLLLFVIGFANTQCGGKTKMSQVKVELEPKVPIVITGDLTIGTRIVKAPWFSFQLNITNDSTETVSIMAISLEITAVSINGGFIVVENTITPSDSSVKYKCPGTETTITLSFTDFGEYLAGESKPLFVKYRGADAASCLNSDDPLSPVTIYVGGNPSEDSGAIDFSYSVQATVVGWFGGVNSPSDRFSKELFFNTQ